MIHYLRIEVTPQTRLSVEDLWKQVLSAIYDELRALGVTVSPEEPRHHETDVMWTAVVKLAPEGSGLLIMSVSDKTPPYSVMFALRDDVLTETSYAGVMAKVENLVAERLAASVSVHLNQVDDLPAMWLDDSIDVPANQSVPEASRPPAQPAAPVPSAAARGGTGRTYYELRFDMHPVSTVTVQELAEGALGSLMRELAKMGLGINSDSAYQGQRAAGGYFMTFDLDPQVAGRLELVVDNVSEQQRVWYRIYETAPGYFDFAPALREVGEEWFNSSKVEWHLHRFE